MILDVAKMIKTLYKDSRGHHGESGQLYLYEDISGIKYLVKRKPLDVANEYVSHSIARLIGIPTSDSVLIRENRGYSVGIEFEEDFQRISMDDFFGTEKYEDDDLNMGYPPVSMLKATEAKYPDDNPHLAEAMKYMALRHIVVMDDNPQVAFAHGKLISFDYACSFKLTEDLFDGLMSDNRTTLESIIAQFKRHLAILHGYKSSLELLRRPNTERLFDAYFDPVLNFHDVDFNLLFDELKQAFSKTIVDFYGACFQLIKQEVEEITSEESA